MTLNSQSWRPALGLTHLQKACSNDFKRHRYRLQTLKSPTRQSVKMVSRKQTMLQAYKFGSRMAYGAVGWKRRIYEAGEVTERSFAQVPLRERDCELQRLQRRGNNASVNRKQSNSAHGEDHIGQTHHGDSDGRKCTQETHSLTTPTPAGERPQDSPHLLQGQGLQKAHQPQGHAVQSRQSTPPPTHTYTTTFDSDRSCVTGISLRARKAPLRPQAVRVRRTDQTGVPQEGQDDEEGRAAVGMHAVQDQGAAGAEAVQALRAGVCLCVAAAEIVWG